jgi:hypothetical protein
MEEFGRPARGAGGEVGLLDQRNPEAPCREIESDATPGDPASHHHYIEQILGTKHGEMSGAAPGHQVRLGRRV